MNETRTINLNGMVYHIDHDAYQLLRDYLQDIEIRLPINDKKEVMEDIEARIAELFQKALFAKNVQVINIQMVQSIQSQIGEPAEFGPNRRPKVKVDKSQNSGCGRVLSITLKVLLVLLALPFLGTLLSVLFALVVAFTGVTFGLGTALPLLPMLTPLTTEFSPLFTALTILCIILIIGLPIVMLVHTIVVFMRTRRGPKARFWWITLILWLLSLIGLGSLATHIVTTVDINNIVKTIDQWDDMDNLPLLSDTRMVEPFHAVEVYGAAQITLSHSDTQQLIVNARNLSDIVTEVRDGVLYVTVPNKAYEPMVLDIAVPTLSLIRAVGASSIETEYANTLIANELTLDLAGAAEADLELQVKTLTIDAKGAASLDLSGSADSVNITLAGAGEIDSEALIAQNMHINCMGASEAEVYVTRELWAQAAGASKITYKGNPRIKQNIAVGGSTIRKDK